MRVMLCLFLSFFPFYEAKAASFDFFGGKDIDYWHEGRSVPKSQRPSSLSQSQSSTSPSQEVEDDLPTRWPTATQNGSNLVRSQDTKPFAWENYQDPSKVEFWDDGGEWIPPRPFREAAQNPTPENVRSYLKWQESKSKVVARLQKAIDEQSSSNSPSQARDEVSFKDVKVAYFYQSSCGHCRASVRLVQSLQKEGVPFTFIQLDQGPPLHEPSLAFDETWAKEFPISVTPTWVIKFRDQVITRTGETSRAAFVQTIQDLRRKKS